MSVTTGAIEVKVEIDETKVFVYTRAQRLRDNAVKELDAIRLERANAGVIYGDINEIIVWLKELEV